MKQLLNIFFIVCMVLINAGCAQNSMYILDRAEKVPESEVKKMEQTLLKHPHNEKNRESLILAYIRNEEYERARKLLSQVLAEKKNDLKATYLMGLTYSRQDLKEEALGYYKKAVALNNTYIPALFNMAAVEEKKNNLEKARKLYQKILDLNPDDGDTHYNLAVLYDTKLAEEKKALYHYEKCLELYKNDSAKNQISQSIRERIDKLKSLQKE